jgi:hypothetical protein
MKTHYKVKFPLGAGSSRSGRFVNVECEDDGQQDAFLRQICFESIDDFITLREICTLCRELKDNIGAANGNLSLRKEGCKYLLRGVVTCLLET